MARPLKKGPPISFRLPLALNRALEVRAAKTHEKPADYVRRVVSRSLEADLPPDDRTSVPTRHAENCGCIACREKVRAPAV